MKSTLGIILMGLMPFFAAGLFLIVLRAIDWHNQRKYERAIERRNALQELYGMKPFRGAKAMKEPLL